MAKLFQWDSETMQRLYGIKTIQVMGNDVEEARNIVEKECEGAPEDFVQNILGDISKEPMVFEFQEFARTVK